MNIAQASDHRVDSLSIQSEFSQISRSWDANNGICVARILPGEYYVTGNDEMITTVLGSCVSACIRDPSTGVGGMNHFMLPGSSQVNVSTWGGQECLTTRYGIAAMEILVNDILKRGARKDQLELKLFGGGEVLSMEVNNIGQRNIEFVRQFALTESMHAVAEDLGGPYSRKINYFPKNGKVLVRRLRSLQSKTIIDREKNYESNLVHEAASGGIELFD